TETELELPKDVFGDYVDDVTLSNTGEFVFFHLTNSGNNGHDDNLLYSIKSKKLEEHLTSFQRILSEIDNEPTIILWNETDSFYVYGNRAGNIIASVGDREGGAVFKPSEPGSAISSLLISRNYLLAGTIDGK